MGALQKFIRSILESFEEVYLHLLFVFGPEFVLCCSILKMRRNRRRFHANDQATIDQEICDAKRPACVGIIGDAVL